MAAEKIQPQLSAILHPRVPVREVRHAPEDMQRPFALPAFNKPGK